MALRRGSRFLRTSGARRKNSWGVGPQSNTGGAPATTITGTTVAAGGVSALAALDGLTLVRTRGSLLVQLVTASNAGDGFHGAFGIAKANSPALTAGIASLPTPNIEDDWDGWIYHRYFELIAGGAISEASGSNEPGQGAVHQALRVEIDSKAMRKVAIEEGFYMAIDVIIVGTATMFWTANSRMLFKLP